MSVTLTTEMKATEQNTRMQSGHVFDRHVAVARSQIGGSITLHLQECRHRIDMKATSDLVALRQSGWHIGAMQLLGIFAIGDGICLTLELGRSEASFALLAIEMPDMRCVDLGRAWKVDQPCGRVHDPQLVPEGLEVALYHLADLPWFMDVGGEKSGFPWCSGVSWT